MMRRGGNGAIRLPLRRLHGCRDQVILEIAAQHVAVLIVGQLFVERGSQSLGESAMHLALNDHGVDDRTAVIYSNEATNMDFTCPPVDIYDTDVAAEGIGEFRRVVIVDSL